METLSSAYHSLIDCEYEKYCRNMRIEEAYLTKQEAISTISSFLRCDKQKAEEILNLLIKQGFIVINGEETLRTIHFDLAYRISNITIEYGSLRYPLETKVYVRNEEIPNFNDHKFNEIEEFIPKEIYQLIRHALYKDPNKLEGLGELSGFSNFQFNAIRLITRGDKKAYLLTAPTSGGKTYAFLIPVLATVLDKKLRGTKNDEGIKAMLIYPRKSLERDQFNKILGAIYRINFYLERFGKENAKITIGIDDGETPWKEDVESKTAFRRAICPACGINGREGGELEYVRTTKKTYVRCSNCGTAFDWIYSFREEIWAKKPDILLTNVWTLDWRLPSKSIQSDFEVFKGINIIVLDEAHVYQSLLGGNVRYLLKRLKVSSKTEPLIILSSATISRPKDFGRDLLDMEPDKDFTVIESLESRKNKKVIYLILAVNPLRSWETVVYELALLLGSIYYFREMQGVIFIDSIRELYRIYHQARVAALHYCEPKDHFNQRLVPDPGDPYAYWPYAINFKGFDTVKTPTEIFEKIRIHHAGVKDREKIEKDFVDGKLGVLISTSTLELGVDYPKVTFIGIVGVPFMLESIPQRVGRAGRNVEKTLNTTLAILILRNTPLELYYLYNPESLIDGFKNKNIPVAWKNTAVKRYHTFSFVMDEMAREGKNTYILSIDGKFLTLDEFIEEVMKTAAKISTALLEIDSRVSKEDITSLNLLEELKDELKKLPKRVEEWKKLNEYAVITGEIVNTLRKVARRARRLAIRINDKKIEELSLHLFKLLRRMYP